MISLFNRYKSLITKYVLRVRIIFVRKNKHELNRNAIYYGIFRIAIFTEYYIYKSRLLKMNRLP